MDQTKFEHKILDLIKSSLKIQSLQKTLDPCKLIDNRDRYFLVQCVNGNKRKKQCVFLRYEDTFYFLTGMMRLPEEKNKRHYDAKIRVPIEKIAPEKRIKEKEKRDIDINKRLDKIIDIVERKRPT